MTNEPEMTLESAKMAVKSLYEACCIDGDRELPEAYFINKGFIAGHAAASKEAEIYREALEKIDRSPTITHGPMDAALKLATAREIAKEALSKGKSNE